MRADPPPDGFYAPDPYANTWILAGLALLVAIAAWYLLVWWVTRERKPPSTAVLSGDRLERLRSDCLRQIALIVADVRAGRVSERRGHQRLSLLVRHFVMQTSGITATAMTLTDLRGATQRECLEPVGDVVEVLYPGEFGADGSVSVDTAATAARRVVAQWT